MNQYMYRNAKVKQHNTNESTQSEHCNRSGPSFATPWYPHCHCRWNAPTREDKSKEDCSGNGASGYAPTMRFSTISAAGPLSAGTCRQQNNWIQQGEIRRDYPNERPSWCKTTMMRDNPDETERQPWWQATLMRDHPNERPPWSETTLMKDHPDGRPPWWTLMRDHPDVKPPWWKTTLRWWMGKLNRKVNSAFVFHWTSSCVCCYVNWYKG